MRHMCHLKLMYVGVYVCVCLRSQILNSQCIVCWKPLKRCCKASCKCGGNRYLCRLVLSRSACWASVLLGTVGNSSRDETVSVNIRFILTDWLQLDAFSTLVNSVSHCDLWVTFHCRHVKCTQTSAKSLSLYLFRPFGFIWSLSFCPFFVCDASEFSVVQVSAVFLLFFNLLMVAFCSPQLNQSQQKMVGIS